MKLGTALTAICMSSFATTSAAENISVVSWNIENWGDSDAATISRDLRDDFRGIDIFGLNEISNNEDYELYAEYASEDEEFSYNYVAGTTGRNVRLGILFNANRFTLNDTYEMLDMMGTPAPGKTRTGRAPLVANFTTKDTGLQFLFVVNHFHRGDERRRIEQAELFAAWAGEQTLPIIATGDYNFDFDLDTQKGNVAYEVFMDAGTFQWIRPETMITTNWSDNNNDTENDYNSILDFVFLANADWTALSKIIMREGDFPDDEYTSDHRPVLGVLSTDSGVDLAGLAESMDSSSDEPTRLLQFGAATPRASMVNVTAATAERTQNHSLIERFRTPQAAASSVTGAPMAQSVNSMMIEVQRLRQEVEALKDQIADQ